MTAIANQSPAPENGPFNENTPPKKGTYRKRLCLSVLAILVIAWFTWSASQEAEMVEYRMDDRRRAQETLEGTPETPGTTPATVDIPASELRLPTTVSPINYDLTIKTYLPGYGYEADHKNLTFEGHVDIKVSITDKTKVITMNTMELVYVKAEFYVEGRKIGVDKVIVRESHELVDFHLEEAVEPTDGAVLKVTFHGKLRTDMTGLYQTSYPAKSGIQKLAAVTQMEPTYTRRMLPCFDEPVFRATWTVTVIHPIGTVALANGIEESSESLGQFVTSKFKTTPSMSSYLLAIFVSEFQFNEGRTSSGVRFRVWSRPEEMEATKYAVFAGVKCLEFFAKYFDISFAVYLIFGSSARLFCNLIGFGYPMYASVKAIRTKHNDDVKAWLMYWRWFAVLCFFDFFSEAILTCFPCYYIFKAVFLVHLSLPKPRGSICFRPVLLDDPKSLRMSAGNDDAKEPTNYVEEMDVRRQPEGRDVLDNSVYEVRKKKSCEAAPLQAKISRSVEFDLYDKMTSSNRSSVLDTQNTTSTALSMSSQSSSSMYSDRTNFETSTEEEMRSRDHEERGVSQHCTTCQESFAAVMKLNAEMRALKEELHIVTKRLENLEKKSKNDDKENGNDEKKGKKTSKNDDKENGNDEKKGKKTSKNDDKENGNDEKKGKKTSKNDDKENGNDEKKGKKTSKNDDKENGNDEKKGKKTSKNDDEQDESGFDRSSGSHSSARIKKPSRGLGYTTNEDLQLIQFVEDNSLSEYSSIMQYVDCYRTLHSVKNRSAKSLASRLQVLAAKNRLSADRAGELEERRRTKKEQ